MTAVIDSLRALLSGHAPGASAVAAVAWSLGIILVSATAAGALFRRRTG